MSYSGFTPGLNFGFDPGKVNITNLKYGSPVGGMTNTPPGSFSLEKLTPEAQAMFAFAKGTRPDPIDYAGLTGFMREQSDIAKKVAQDKFRDETNFGMLMTGTKAAADGLQTALAGGSKEMLAYNAQAPLREGQAYLRNSQNRQRPEIAQQQIPTYIPQRFFG